MLLEVATRLADLWLARGRSLPPDALKARAAVASSEPCVVVTGGSRGIGEALAETFAGRGHRVAVVARDAGRCAEAARRIADRVRQPVIPIACDVASPDAVDTVTRALAAERLYLDILVNNAGVGLGGPLIGQSEAQLEALIAVNIDALTRLTRAALPDMLARRRGGLLNVASLGAYAPGPYQAAYYASKSYVLSLTEALAVENAGQGVRFCVLAPGPVDTGFHADMGADAALYRTLLPAASAQRTAQAAYRGYMVGQRVVVAGPLNRAALAGLKLLPRAASAALVGRLLRRPQDRR